MSYLPRESSMEVDHVDPPAGPSGLGGGTLKRSNSAPSINMLVSTVESHTDSEIRYTNRYLWKWNIFFLLYFDA